MKETSKDKTTAKTTKVVKTTKAKTVKEEPVVKKTTRKRKVKEPEEEPDFKSIKEEIAWLKNRKSLSPCQAERLSFLDRPIQVYTDYASVKKAQKEASKKTSKPKKKVKPAVKYENGEYVPTPKTFTQLKSYVNTYCRAMGWKDKKFKFQQCKNLGFKDLKVTGDKETKEVYLTGSLVFQTPRQMFTKSFSRIFTIETHQKIRELIKNTYRQVIENWTNRDHVDGDELMKKGWSCVYDE